MTQKRRLLILFLIVFKTNLCQSADWHCSITDMEHKSWTANNEYHKKALNSVFEDCKKASRIPSSCKKSQILCEGGQDRAPSPSWDVGWRCTAIDRAARAWTSKFYKSVDAAAFGAQAFCFNNSRVPETCYVNFITCIHNWN